MSIKTKGFTGFKSGDATIGVRLDFFFNSNSEGRSLTTKRHEESHNSCGVGDLLQHLWI